MVNLKTRKPAVAGQFYSSGYDTLKKEIEGLIDKKAVKSNVIACVLPHAGYMYSGAVAGKTVSRINIKERIIILGPNHTGYGPDLSIMTEGIWETPLGNIEIDSQLAQGILNGSAYLKEDTLAHTYEHSVEVEVPFLQYFRSDFRIVPIIILSQDKTVLKKVGEEIAEAVDKTGIKDSTLIVASTDFTHYEPQPEATRKDKEAIKAILELDEDKLIDVVEKDNISMCGYGPVTIVLTAGKILGAKNARLIQYQTSGDITGDKLSVVGYAGIIIY